MNVQPGLAPAMLPSVCCARAPGASLLCQVRLGLRPAGSPVADSSSAVSSTVLSLSATGGVGVVQLLLPKQSELLQEWQQRAALDLTAAGQLLQWTQGADRQGASTVSAGIDLQGLLLPDEVCSYTGHDRAPGALQPGPREAGRQQQEPRGLLCGAVDGDLLFMGVRMQEGSQRSDATGALVLQQRLWQGAL
jgi:hypothetical protein